MTTFASRFSRHDAAASPPRNKRKRDNDITDAPSSKRQAFAQIEPLDSASSHDARIDGIDSDPTSATTSRLHPQNLAILHQLYILLEVDTHRGFDQFTARYTEAQLLDVIERSFREPVLILLEGTDFTNKQALLDIGGDVKYKGPGLYMDVLTDDNAAEWFKLYGGQAERVKVRTDYHKKPSVLKKNTALHYQLLRKPGRNYDYVLVAALPENEPVDTQLLDVLEMYTGLVFQMLPSKTLTKYLPSGSVVRQPERGCMVANPLNQHHDDEAARRASCQLRDSTDPEIRAHYKDACDYLRLVEYRPTMEAMRQKSKKKDLFRPATNEFERVVHIRCNTCKADVSIKQDPLPIFDKDTGNYLIRQQSCFNCPVAGAKKGDRRQFKSTMFYPIDGRPTMSMSWLGKHTKTPRSTNQYEDNGRWKAPTVVKDE
ncbi:hypothetical protein LTR56_012063 [Elasticomyces elasticus]|nr:hypothetical protein LTR56_012063 [Elasticomyces elasticus]KAK3651812.1 hypothetical protein LTR22_011982 [Elasticomyces elasticus]KAK4930170.1 hypothetical protein LTR49_003204 [Elasticomyces elasticus]KAK5752507.1 hypothetical protein LTS12_017445 [Elasticomyces elasticus]